MLAMMPWRACSAVHGERGARGFSLVELMTVIAIIAILLSVATPTFISIRQNEQLNATVNKLAATLANARAEAIRRNTRTVVIPSTGGNWVGTQGWISCVDLSHAHTCQSTGVDVILDTQTNIPSIVTVAALPANVIAMPTAGVGFSGEGYTSTAAGGNFQAFALQLTNGTISRRLQLRQTGQIVICDPSVTSDYGICG